jgi:predicted NBD/HSP70 family sugar kinase
VSEQTDVAAVRPRVGPDWSARPTAARQANLRDHNLAVALSYVAHSAEPVSRADIAAASGLTRATASSLVEALLHASLVRELEPGPRSGAGRPAAGLVLAPEGAGGLGLEINVDYLAACVLDLTGAVRHRVVVQQDQRGRTPARTFADLADLVGGALAAATAVGVPVRGAALALPGLVDARRGLLRTAPNLGWTDVDVLDLLRDGPLPAGLPVTVDNEANLAALGELYGGGAGGAESFVHISGEVGIGAGIVLDRRLFRGTHGWGGEIGHVPVRPDGRPCHCGARGCLETVAGQDAIARAAGVRRTDGVPGTDGARSGASGIVELARAGRPAALTALAEAGEALGTALAGVVNLLDVDTLVLGGLYSTLAPWIAPPVEVEIARRVLANRWSPVSVVVSALGRDAAVLGAAGAVLQDQLDNPAALVG